MTSTLQPRKGKLMEQVRTAIRVHGYTPATEKTYVYWIKRYIVHHGKQNPERLGAVHIRDFLSALVIETDVSASTQNSRSTPSSSCTGKCWAPALRISAPSYAPGAPDAFLWC